jgi:hypothetical protein
MRFKLQKIDIFGDFLRFLIHNTQNGNKRNSRFTAEIETSTKKVCMSSVGATYRSWKSEITPHSIGGTEYPFIVGLIEVEYHNQIPQGCVIDQHPVPGAMAVVDTPVDLTVSLGVEMVSVPDLLGLDQAGAETLLSEASLAVGDITVDYADTVPADRVFDQAPMAGTRVPAGTPVSLSLSLGVWTGVDTEPPRVRLTATPERIDLGQSVHLTLWVSDNAGVVERTLTIDGTPVPLVGNRLDYTPEHWGGITVTATASDAAGHTAADSITVTVVDPNDTTPPVVDLDEDDCADVTSLYSLTGTIAEEGSFTYQLLFREKGAVDWRVLSEGQGSGSLTGELAVFDPTLLVNGVYEIKLLAEDANGNVGFDTGCALVDGKLKPGPAGTASGGSECHGPGAGPDPCARLRFALDRCGRLRTRLASTPQPHGGEPDLPEILLRRHALGGHRGPGRHPAGLL